MVDIRKIKKEEKNIIPLVVEIHIKSFKGFFLTFLGKGFLRLLYASFVRFSESDIIVAFENDKPVGFIAYSKNMSGLYKYMINHYINAGVVLMNLKRMREMHSERIVDDFMENHINDVKYGDQDIINLAFKDEIYILPNEYNVHGTNYFNRNTYKKPVIIHHVCKAWVFGKKTYYQSKYFKYLRKTDYKMQPRIKEFWWRIKTWLSVFWGNILHPSRVFNYEYMYGVYRWMFKRFAKKQK